MGANVSIALLFGFLLILLAKVSHADEKSGWAMSAGVGISLIRNRDREDTFEDNDVGYTWGVEYRFSKRWALGIDFYSLGSGNDTFESVDTTIDVGGFDLRGRLIHPLAETVEFYGRLGFGGYFADVDPGGSNLGEEAVSVGLGLDFDRSPHFTVRIDGRYLRGPRDESGGLLTGGLNYRF